MLFDYIPSNKKFFSMGFSLVMNLLGFIAFEFYLPGYKGLGILFLGSFFMYLVLIAIKIRKKQKFEFFENEIKVNSLSENKVLSSLNLIFVQNFHQQKQPKETTHLISNDAEYTFNESEHSNYQLVKEYLESRVQVSDIAKYRFFITQLKERIPSLLASLGFLAAYVYYFKFLSTSNIFFQIIIGIQAAMILFYMGQWFYYKNKIKQLDPLAD